MDITQDRRQRLGWKAQLAAIGPLLVVWAVGMGVLWIAANQRRVPLDYIFLDPATLSGRPWYTGILHEAGVFFWSVAAVSALGGAWVAHLTGRLAAARFLAAGGLLSILLFGDELLEIHARLAPAIGIPKSVAILAIVGLSATWALTSLGQITRTRWLMLASALAALATSVLVDHFRPGTSLSVFAEDAPKLLGEAAWATYFVTTAADIVRSAVTEPRPDPGHTPAD